MEKPTREERKKNRKSSRRNQPYRMPSPDDLGLLMNLQVGMCLMGGAVRVGLTRDMGALALGLYMGNEYDTEYVRPDESLEVALRTIVLDWELTVATWDDVAEVWTLD